MDIPNKGIVTQLKEKMEKCKFLIVGNFNHLPLLKNTNNSNLPLHTYPLLIPGTSVGGTVWNTVTGDEDCDIFSGMP